MPLAEQSGGPGQGLQLRIRLLQRDIGDLLADYGAWTDDEKYRRLYLRPFDRKWGDKSLRLEEFLQSRLDEHSKK
jgi:hypothetical protein